MECSLNKILNNTTENKAGYNWDTHTIKHTPFEPVVYVWKHVTRPYRPRAFKVRYVYSHSQIKLQFYRCKRRAKNVPLEIQAMLQIRFAFLRVQGTNKEKIAIKGKTVILKVIIMNL